MTHTKSHGPHTKSHTSPLKAIQLYGAYAIDANVESIN